MTPTQLSLPGTTPSAGPSADAGIDYGMGMSNVDRATRIRYGCISQHSLCQEALNDCLEPDYGDPSCPECGGEVIDSSEVRHPDLWKPASSWGCFDYACLKCRHALDSSECFPEDPISREFNADGYAIVDCLDSDLLVIRSPFYTFAQFCSPCVPGAGNLDCPIDGGVKTFCLGADWFEDGRAPYPVYLVSDDSVVAAAAEEGEERTLPFDPLNNPGNIGGFHRAGEIHG